MAKLRTPALFIVFAHLIIAIWHLFIAANVLPAPNNHMSWLAVTLITSGHLVASIALWKLNNKLGGLVSLIFFLAALSADLYEHFLHASLNNIFMLVRGDWTAIFDVSVFLLLALEILGCSLGTLMLGGGKRSSKSAAESDANLNRRGPKLASSLY